jgi:hypothetical protein
MAVFSENCFTELQTFSELNCKLAISYGKDEEVRSNDFSRYPLFVVTTSVVSG